jgi:hypothetical protein
MNIYVYYCVLDPTTKGPHRDPTRSDASHERADDLDATSNYSVLATMSQWVPPLGPRFRCVLDFLKNKHFCHSNLCMNLVYSFSSF